jgi:hypothetical protein
MKNDVVVDTYCNLLRIYRLLYLVLEWYVAIRIGGYLLVQDTTD